MSSRTINRAGSARSCWFRMLLACVAITATLAFTPEAEAQANKRPVFRASDLKPRTHTGSTYIGIFGGGNVFQHAFNDDVTSGGLNGSFDHESSAGGVGGMEIGYQWPTRYIGTYGDNGQWGLIPAIEAEAFYTGFGLDDGRRFGGANNIADYEMDTFVFTVNGMLKFDLGTFRPFLSAGVGGAYVNANLDMRRGGTQVVNDDAEDFVLAFQAGAGVDVKLAKEWYLNFEYKYLHFNDLNFSHSSTLGQNVNSDFGGIGQHLVTAGIRYHFY